MNAKEPIILKLPTSFPVPTSLHPSWRPGCHACTTYSSGGAWYSAGRVLNCFCERIAGKWSRNNGTRGYHTNKTHNHFQFMMDCPSNPEATESQLAEVLGTTSGDNEAIGLQFIYTHTHTHIYIYHTISWYHGISWYILYIYNVFWTCIYFDQQRNVGLQGLVALHFLAHVTYNSLMAWKYKPYVIIRLLILWVPSLHRLRSDRFLRHLQKLSQAHLVRPLVGSNLRSWGPLQQLPVHVFNPRRCPTFPRGWPCARTGWTCFPRESKHFRVWQGMILGIVPINIHGIVPIL